MVLRSCICPSYLTCSFLPLHRSFYQSVSHSHTVRFRRERSPLIEISLARSLILRAKRVSTSHTCRCARRNSRPITPRQPSCPRVPSCLCLILVEPPPFTPLWCQCVSLARTIIAFASPAPRLSDFFKIEQMTLYTRQCHVRPARFSTPWQR